MTDLAKLVVRLEAETSRYQKELEGARKQLKRFDEDTTKLAKNVGKGLAVAATAAATAIGVLIYKSLEQADHLNDLSKSTGVSVENLSKLGFIAAQSGADLDTLSVGLKKLNNNISEAAGNAKSDAAIAFKAMGISVRDASGNVKAADVVLAELADKFATYKDGPNKVAIALALLGKAGEALIPTLNEGAAGFKAMGEQAEKAGAVISTDTAKAADEFNDRVGRLKLGVAGFGNQVLEQLLPAMNNLSKTWEEDADRAGSLAAGAKLMADVLKGVATIGIGVVSVFQQVGRAIYGVVAAQFALAKGDFRQAGREIASTFVDITKNVASDAAKIKALWADTVPSAKAAADGVKAIGDATKKDAPNLAGAKALATTVDKVAEAAKRAREKLDDMNKGIAEQVATFDLGDAAATKYRLTQGSLADDVSRAGKAGLELRDSIIANAEAFERLGRAKEVAEALKGVNAQIAELKGNTAEAELARFDQSNAELVKKLRQDGNQAGLEQLASLRSLIEAQARYNVLQQDAERIQTDLAIAEERIKNSREAGAITEFDSLKQTSEARQKAHDELGAIYEQQKKIAEESGNPALIEGAKKFGAAIEDLGSQVDLVGQKVRSIGEDVVTGFLTDLASGAKSLKDTVKDALDNIASQLLEFAARNLAQNFIGGLFGAAGGGGGAGGFLSSLFGRAGGGGVRAGQQIGRAHV